MPRKKKASHIEIKKGMRSFAFLSLQVSVTRIRDLLASVNSYNEFPHTMENDLFFSFMFKKFQNKTALAFEGEDATDYILRLDLGRNLEFLHELAFLYLVNGFITYCADILAIAALGSPEKFDFPIRERSSNLLRATSSHGWKNEIGISIATRILVLPYSELRTLLLSKAKIGKLALEKLAVIERAVKKRNKLTHGRGVSNLAIEIHELGGWQPRVKITQRELISLWLAIGYLSRAIDISFMKQFDVWRGVDICAPGLYRKADGRPLREGEDGAYRPLIPMPKKSRPKRN